MTGYIHEQQGWIGPPSPDQSCREDKAYTGGPSTPPSPLCCSQDYARRARLPLFRYPWESSSAATLMRNGIGNDTFRAIKRLVRPEAVVFDIGANIGSSTFQFAKLTGPLGRVFAFEPVESTYWHLPENIALNRLTCITPLQLALGEYTGECDIFLYGRGYSGWNGRGGAPMGRISAAASQQVKITTIDNFCRSNHIENIRFSGN